MSINDNLPAVIPEPVKVRAVLHPQGNNQVIAEFPDYKEVLVVASYALLQEAILEGFRGYCKAKNIGVMQIDVLWEVATPASPGGVLDRSFRTETCRTCDFFLRTPGDSIHRKDICRYWVPTSTAQNQYGYLTNVDDDMPACGCYQRHPGDVMVWNQRTNDPDSKFVEEQHIEEPVNDTVVAWDPIKGDYVEVKI
jgi:hypothetical protein